MRFDAGRYGIAILARPPVHGVITMSPRRSDRRNEPRILIAVKSPGFPGIATTHLSRRPEGAARSELTELLPKLPAWVEVVAGDLNHPPGDNLPWPWVEMSALRDGGFQPTWPATFPTEPIDRVLGHCETITLRARVLDVRLSDHLPVLVELGAKGDDKNHTRN